MNQSNHPNRGRYLALYLTGEHPCSYLEKRQARTLFVDPTAGIDSATYQVLVAQGFRRSGSHIYRPACRGCAKCVPVRIPTQRFQPNRSQRRNWKLNFPDLLITETPATFTPSHYALYRRYLAERHPNGSMADDATEENYRRFLIEPWGGSTRFIELWLDMDLVGVAVTDMLEHGLSAVYTFFDPDASSRALGTFAVLAQIEMARRLGMPHLYLGYWIRESRKMTYKDHFRPIEAWDGRQWRYFECHTPLDLG